MACLRAESWLFLESTEQSVFRVVAEKFSTFLLCLFFAKHFYVDSHFITTTALCFRHYFLPLPDSQIKSLSSVFSNILNVSFYKWLT